MGDAKVLVEQKIAGKRVVVFSKRTCPFCTKAKKTFEKYQGDVLPDEDYEVIEIDGLPDCEAIQSYLQKKTGGRTVPRVFIDNQFIGGGDDVVAKDKSGELKKLLAKV